MEDFVGVIEAVLWGLGAGSSLLLGAGAVLAWPRLSEPRVVGLIMGFGAGTLISAVSLELALEGYNEGGPGAVGAGLLVGATGYYGVNRVINRRGGKHRKNPGRGKNEAEASAITLGIVFDGIPESVAIGLTLIGNKAIGLSLIGAVFLSNMPEALGATALLRSSHSTLRIMLRWAGIALISGLAAGVGYVLLEGASPELIAAFEAVAAGAILVMLADTMIPVAFDDAGNTVGLATTAGFATAFFLSTVGVG